MEHMEHGEYNKSNGNRWCAEHNQWHGHLYICPSYTDGMKKEIQEAGARFRNNLNDSAWIREQEKNGVPKEVIAIFRFFSGM